MPLSLPLGHCSAPDDRHTWDSKPRVVRSPCCFKRGQRSRFFDKNLQILKRCLGLKTKQTKTLYGAKQISVPMMGPLGPIATSGLSSGVCHQLGGSSLPKGKLLLTSGSPPFQLGTPTVLPFSPCSYCPSPGHLLPPQLSLPVLTALAGPQGLWFLGGNRL